MVHRPVGAGKRGLQRACGGEAEGELDVQALEGAATR